MVLAVICAVGEVPVLDVVLLLVDNVELGFVVDNVNATVLCVGLLVLVAGGVLGEPPVGLCRTVPVAIPSQYSRLRRPFGGRAVSLERGTLGVLWSRGLWDSLALARRLRVSIIPCTNLCLQLIASSGQ